MWIIQLRWFYFLCLFLCISYMYKLFWLNHKQTAAQKVKLLNWKMRCNSIFLWSLHHYLYFFSLSHLICAFWYRFNLRSKCNSAFLFLFFLISILITKNATKLNILKQKHFLSVTGIEAPKNLRLRDLFTIQHTMTMKCRWRLMQTRETDTKSFPSTKKTKMHIISIYL